jgi:hypothetical protein
MISSPRRALVYVGGMQAVRSLGRLASLVCVSGAAASLRSVLSRGRTNFAFLAIVCAAAIVVAVGSRVTTLHSVVVRRGCWMLLPLVGKPKFMAPVVEVYEHGDDVIAIGIDGRTTVLGVGRFPFREHAAVRRSLVEAMRRANELL